MGQGGRECAQEHPTLGLEAKGMGSLAIAGWGPLDGPLVECIYRVTLHLSCISAAVAEDLSPTPALPLPSSVAMLPSAADGAGESTRSSRCCSLVGDAAAAAASAAAFLDAGPSLRSLVCSESIVRFAALAVPAKLEMHYILVPFKQGACRGSVNLAKVVHFKGLKLVLRRAGMRFKVSKLPRIQFQSTLG
eukprot:1150279-Pelagomonas_calceolata.AAC.1